MYQPSSNHKAAHDLATAGLFVFPCHSSDGQNFKIKQPCVSWRSESTTNLALINQWWSTNPHCLVGIDCGKSKLLVIDLDVHDPSKNGVDHFKAFAQARGDDLSSMPIVQTVSGGYHLYYGNLDAQPLGNSRGVFAGCGIDVRGDGGLVIAPGSKLPDGSGWTAIANRPDLLTASNNGSLPPLPDWLLDALRPKPSSKVAPRDKSVQHCDLSGSLTSEFKVELAKLVGMWPGSGRNDALNKTAFLAGKAIISDGLDEEEATQSLLYAVGVNGYIAKDGREATLRTINSGISAGKRWAKPTSNVLPEKRTSHISAETTLTGPTEAPLPLRRDLPPPPPFPVSALGDVLGGATEAIVDIVQCPEAIAALSVLGVASLICQAHANITFTATGHPKPLSLFLVSIAASGERKSAADYEALAPVRDYEAELAERYVLESVSYSNAAEAFQWQREAIKKDKNIKPEAKARALADMGPPPEQPLLPILTCSEPTFEGLCKVYPHGMPMLGIFSDEGGQFVGGHGMAKENQLRTASGLSSLWDGSPIKRVRSGDGVSVLPGRRLAVHLMMQPDVGSTLLTDPVLRDQGLLSRCLVTAPSSKAGTRLQRPPKPESRIALNNYKSRASELLRTELRTVDGTRNVLLLPSINLDVYAEKAWRNYADSVEMQIKLNGRYATIAGFANKMPEHVLRIAGVFAVFEGKSHLPVSEQLLQRAIELVDYFALEALRLFDGQAISAELSDAEALLHWITTSWQELHVGLKVIYQMGPKRVRHAKQAKRAVETLVSHGYLSRAPSGTMVNGHAVLLAWSLNPAIANNNLVEGSRVAE